MRKPLVRPWSEAERQELSRMWLAGASAPQIAARLRRNTSAVDRQRRLLGLPTQAQRTSGLDVAVKTGPGN